MSYQEYPLSNFPEQVDDIQRMQDIYAEDVPLVNQYKGYVMNGDIQSANELLENNPELKNKIFNAHKVNSLADAIQATQKFFNENVQGFIEEKQAEMQEKIDQFDYKGNYNPNTQYYAKNVVAYDDGEDVHMYVCVVDNMGKYPTMNNYWKRLTIKGDPGKRGNDGLGNVVVKGAWDNAFSYSKGESVQYGGMLFTSIIDNNVGNEPDLTLDTAYWHKTLDITVTVARLKGTYALGNQSNSIPFMQGNITAFNPNTDSLDVYQNSVRLTEGVDYQINSNNQYIDSLGDPWDGSSQTILFEFVVIRNQINDLIFSDGQSIQDGTLTENKLSTDIRNKIEGKANIIISPYEPIEPTKETYWYEEVGTENGVQMQNYKDGVWDKKYPISKTTNIFDLGGESIEEKFKKINKKVNDVFINVKEYGATGDGITDDTQYIQDALDSAPNNSTIIFPHGDYLISKNVNLVDFPNNDQPCLLIRNKKNIKLLGRNALIFTKTHGQGVLEVQTSSNIIIDSVEIKGYSQFPALDGTSGRGEKGDETYGYNTKGFWGYYKNNSSNQLNQSFGGGFIGNVSYGILIHNNCNNVKIKNCETYGFNYVGIGVGHNGDYFPTNLNYPDSKNIFIENCYSHSNYSANYHAMAVDGCNINGSISEYAGHPSSQTTDSIQDPGYGVTLRGTDYSVAKNVNINSNIIKNCIRKGIDSHSSDGVVITDNNIFNCWVGGIFGYYPSIEQSTKNMIVKGNYVEKCGTGGQGGFYYSGITGVDYSLDTIIANILLSNNIFKNCGGRILFLRAFKNAVVSNNQIINVDSNSGYATGIEIGDTDTNYPSYNLLLANNMISDDTGKIYRGIYTNAVQKANVNDNVVLFNQTDLNINKLGIGNSMDNNVNYNNNYVNIGEDNGYPISVIKTSGVANNNIGIGGERNYIPSDELNRLSQSSFNDVFSNAFGNVRKYTLNEDAVLEMQIPDQCFGFVIDNAGRFTMFNSMHENHIDSRLDYLSESFSDTILTGTTGQSGFLNVGKKTGTLYIENRNNKAQTISVIILG